MVVLMYPQAKQSLSPKGLVIREAPCPIHKGFRDKPQISRKFLGPQQVDDDLKVYWAFKCTGKGGHIFLAEPDRNAPTTIRQVEGWKKRQTG